MVERDDILIMRDDDRMKLNPDEVVENRLVRFRTLVRYTLIGRLLSDTNQILEGQLAALECYACKHDDGQRC